MHNSTEAEAGAATATSSDCIKLQESNWKLGDWNNQLLWQFAISFPSLLCLSPSTHAHCDDECNEATNIALHRHARVGQTWRLEAVAGAGREWKTSHGWLTVLLSLTGCQFVWHLNYPLSGCNWTTAELKKKGKHTQTHTHINKRQWCWLWLRIFR